MEGEKTVENPESGTPSPEQQAQTQVDPAAPQGTPAQGEQQGTPGEVDKTEKPETREFFQTKYQELVGILKNAGLDVGALKSGTPPGSLDNAFQDQPTPQQPQEQPEDEFEFDPYDPNSMKTYLDRNFGQIRGSLMDTVRNVVREVRQEEQAMAEWNTQREQFNKWASENKVPQEAINRAVVQYRDEFGTAGTPAAFIKTLKRYIQEFGSTEAMTATQQAAIKEALEKAKALDALEQPAPGAAPSPQPKQEKTWQEKEADDIAPDQEYVPPE